MTNEHADDALRPSHYRWHPDGIEAVTVAEELPYNAGTAVAYIMRAGRKPNTDAIEDLRKAIAHLEFEIARVTRRRDGTPKFVAQEIYAGACKAHDTAMSACFTQSVSLAERLTQANATIQRLNRRKPGARNTTARKTRR